MGIDLTIPTIDDMIAALKKIKEENGNILIQGIKDKEIYPYFSLYLDGEYLYIEGYSEEEWDDYIDDVNDMAFVDAVCRGDYDED